MTLVSKIKMEMTVFCLRYLDIYMLKPPFCIDLQPYLVYIPM